MFERLQFPAALVGFRSIYCRNAHCGLFGDETHIHARVCTYQVRREDKQHLREVWTLSVSHTGYRALHMQNTKFHDLLLDFVFCTVMIIKEVSLLTETSSVMLHYLFNVHG